MLFPPGGTVTVTPNRLSASAGRLGVFFAFSSRGNCYRDPEPDFRISGAVGGVCCFFLPGNDYRDPEPVFRINGAVGGCLLLPSRVTVAVTTNRTSASAGRLGDVCSCPPVGTVTVTPNRLSASAGRLGVFAVFAFGGYLLRGGITASPAFGRPWRRPFRPFCASAPPAGF